MTYLLERTLNRRWANVKRLLTVHDHIHILGKTMDDFEYLNCSHLDLILRESVQPLQYRLDVLLSKLFLNQPRCVLISRLIHR
jgi:hypothetical protein